MPPKQSTAADSDTGSAILTLCHLMATCTEFKADNAALASILGIAQAKNVPRKINSIIGPQGYELRGGKVVNKDEAVQAPTTPRGSSAVNASKTPEAKKAPVTPTTSTKKKGTPKKPASKKRKAETLGNSDAEDIAKEEGEDNDESDD